MKRKVFEQNFKTKIEAVEALEEAGYWYRGRKGLIRKYHRYTGISVYRSLDGFCGYTDRDNIDEYEVRLFDDGYLAIYVDHKSSLLGLSKLPAPVYMDYHAYLNRN